MAWCPNCGSEYQAFVTRCIDCEVPLTGEPRTPTATPEPAAEIVQGVLLGRFDVFVAPILTDLLAERDIASTAKPTDAGPYRTEVANRVEVYVEAARGKEARGIVETTLAERLTELEGSTTEDPAFAEEQPAPELDGWGFEVEQDDLGPTEPFGWMQPDVARVFMELCAEHGIGAQPEYPLDEPAPAYARDDGRVRVHIEQGAAEELEDIVERDLPEALRRHGFVAEEPLVEASD